MKLKIIKNLNAKFEVLEEKELIDKTESLKMVMLLVGFREEWSLDQEL